jgi:hypothetical protein
MGRIWLAFFSSVFKLNPSALREERMRAADEGMYGVTGCPKGRVDDHSRLKTGAMAKTIR